MCMGSLPKRECLSGTLTGHLQMCKIHLIARLTRAFFGCLWTCEIAANQVSLCHNWFYHRILTAFTLLSFKSKWILWVMKRLGGWCVCVCALLKEHFNLVDRLWLPLHISNVSFWSTLTTAVMKWDWLLCTWTVQQGGAAHSFASLRFEAVVIFKNNVLSSG